METSHWDRMVSSTQEEDEDITRDARACSTENRKWRLQFEIQNKFNARKKMKTLTRDTRVSSNTEGRGRQQLEIKR